MTILLKPLYVPIAPVLDQTGVEFLTQTSQEFVDHLTTLTPAERAQLGKRLKPLTNYLIEASGGAPDKAYPSAAKALRKVEAFKEHEASSIWGNRATLLKMAALPAHRAAKVWPVPSEGPYLDAIPRLFPDEMLVFVDTWSEQFCKAPQNGDRNRGRPAIIEWIEQGLAPLSDSPYLPPYFLAVLAQDCMSYVSSQPIVEWLEQHPRLRREVFPRILTTPGVKGSSLEQFEHRGKEFGQSLLRDVLPALIERGYLTAAQVRDAIEWGLQNAPSSYQLRWYTRAAKEHGIL